MELLLRHAALPGIVTLAPWEAVGLVSFTDAAAPAGVPECAVSLRDGYAVSSADTATATPDNPLRLETDGRLTADSRHPAPLIPGHAVRILTGAPMPPGADAVIPLELLAEPSDPNAPTILLDQAVAANNFVLPQGGDLPAGSILARKGHRISPQAAAVLTRARVELLRVQPRPVAAMFGLGSELAAPRPAGDLERIPADNTVLVSHLLRSWGADIKHSGVLPDKREIIAQALTTAVTTGPRPALIVTTGGTGRSERDYAQRAAADAGFSLLFQGMDIRPGKNVFAALRSDPGQPNVLLLGLPGPPAAVFACLHALALPLVRYCCGLDAALFTHETLTDAAPPHKTLQAILREGLRTRRGSDWLLPCTLAFEGGRLWATPLHGEAWTSLRALATAQAVVVLPPESDLLAGSCVELLCDTTLLIGL